MNPRFRFLLSLILLSLCSVTTHSQWVQTIHDTVVSSLAVSGTTLLAGTDGGPGRVYGCDILTSTNNGTNWSAVSINFGGVTVNAFAALGINLFAGTEGNYAGGGILVSSNNGNTWSATPLSRDVYSLVVSGTNLFAGSWGGEVYFSTNIGSTWTTLNLGLNTRTQTLAIKNSKLFAGTWSGGVYLSTNNGSSWSVINNGLANTDVRVLLVSGNNLFAGTYDGLFFSTNDGVSWSAANDGLTNTRVFALAASGTNLFAGTYGGGVFLSTNNGTSWTSVNTGLTTLNILAFVVNGPYLFASTFNGGGIWRRPLSELVSVGDEQAMLPKYFSLGQNYPNPFNPSTTINYSIATRSQVTLKVFDVLGREVASLVSEMEEPGYKLVHWNASNITSGAYFYQLKAGNFTETSKMLLAK